MEDTITRLGQLSLKELTPVIIYLGASPPGADALVNTDQASEKICSYADTAGVQCLSYTIDNAIHNRPDLSTEQLAAALAAAAPEIHTALDVERRWYELANHRIPTRILNR
jgi:hypothetical protein